MSLVGLLVGGALGTLCRYLTSVATNAVLPNATLPAATFLVNVLGCFLIGFVSHLARGGQVSPALALAVGTGFAGAFTTFSTFELEADLMIRSGATGLAAVYVVGSLACGYAALLLGRLAAGRIYGVQP